VFHEIGHIYFYGILGNDERMEAWLDEGFASFMDDWHQQETYGPYGNTHDWNFYQRMTPQYRLWEKDRRTVFGLERRGYGERVSFRAEDYIHSYRSAVYDKSALPSTRSSGWRETTPSSVSCTNILPSGSSSTSTKSASAPCAKR
jgi:hypothetical protein